MKHLSLFGLFLNFILPVQGQNIEVIVKNIKHSEGILMVGLFNSEQTFTKQAWRGQKVQSKPGNVKVVFENVPAGVYAISVYHDANESGKLETNFVGIPKEGFGFSNDVMGTFGPPSFEKASFRCPAEKPVIVTLKYP